MVTGWHWSVTGMYIVIFTLWFTMKVNNALGLLALDHCISIYHFPPTVLFIYLKVFLHTVVTVVIWDLREMALNAGSLCMESLKWTFLTSPSPRHFFYEHVFFCGLEGFMAVTIIIRLGTYTVFSLFKVLFSKKNLKGTFQVHLLFTAVGTTIFTNSRHHCSLLKACRRSTTRKPYNQLFFFWKLYFTFLILSFLFFHYTNCNLLYKWKSIHWDLCITWLTWIVTLTEILGICLIWIVVPFMIITRGIRRN